MIHKNLNFDLNTELVILTKEIDNYISSFDKQEKDDLVLIEKVENFEKSENFENEKIHQQNENKTTDNVEEKQKRSETYTSDLIKSKISHTEYNIRSLIVNINY